MEHPNCAIAEFDVRFAPRIFDRFGRHRLSREPGSPIYIHGLALSPAIQEQMRLLNCSAWLHGELAKDDPLTAVKRLLNRNGDVFRVISQPGMVFRGVRDMATQRAEVTRKYSRLTLRCAVEQRPDSESRIRGCL